MKLIQIVINLFGSFETFLIQSLFLGPFNNQQMMVRAFSLLYMKYLLDIY